MSAPLQKEWKGLAAKGRTSWFGEADLRKWATDAADALDKAAELAARVEDRRLKYASFAKSNALHASAKEAFGIAAEDLAETLRTTEEADAPPDYDPREMCDKGVPHD